MPKGSFQIYSDTNTKIINAYGPGSSNQSGPKTVKVERITNISGSSAGAGSGEFHNYLGIRKRERERLEGIEKLSKEEEERKEFIAKIQQNKEEAEMRTEKNRLKRMKMKDRKKKNKGRALSKESTSNINANTENNKNDDSDNEEEEEKDDIKENEQLAETS
jgi:hypothetical protein